MVLSAFLIVLAIAAQRRFGHASWLGWMLSACIIGVVALSSIQLGMTQITGEGLNGAVFYHMRTGLEGGDVTQYLWVVAGSILALVGVSAALWRGRRFLRPSGSQVRRTPDIAIAALAFAALLVHPVSTASAAYVMRFAFVAQHQEGFFDPAPNPTGPDTPRNLVIIYLESLERTYMDPERFPGLTPNLTSLEQRALSFSNMGQTTGSDFTIGGMVATQCGVPLILASGENSMRVNRFLTGATCLGDILGNAGYTMSYLGGASTEFAGKGSFLRSHGYGEVQGLDQLLPTLLEPDYRAEWGLQDDTLFELARDQFVQLSTNDAPFVLAMLTLDTHHPNGHAETNRACADSRYGTGGNPMLNSVMCTDHLAGQFITDILSGPHANDTVIAVMSDHLAMVNSATDLLDAGQRRNLLMIVDGADVGTGAVIDRPATTFDTGPTLLSYLGFATPQMGFGVDLLGTFPTAPEAHVIGVDDRNALDAHVLGFQSVYERLWAFPDISDGLYVNTERGELLFGHSSFRTPVLLAFDEDNAITQAVLGDAEAEESLSNTALSLPKGTPYMWVDECPVLAMLEVEEQPDLTEGLCILNGRRTAAASLQKLPRSNYFSTSELAAMLSDTGASSDDTDALKRIGSARGDFPIPVALPSLRTGARGVLVQSSAFGAGASFVRRQTIDDLNSGEDWLLGRGVNLVGITPDGRAEVQDRLDQCDPDYNDTTHEPWAARILKGRMQFVAHLIIVHDTAYCGGSFAPLAAPLAGLALDGLRATQMREAYIGVINDQGNVQEFSNHLNKRLKLYLVPAVSTDSASDVLADLPLSYELATARAPASFVNVAGGRTSAQISPERSGSLATSANELPVGTQTEMAATVEVSKTVKCVAPTVAGKSNTPIHTLVEGSRLSGEQMSGSVTFVSGWWGQEQEGRWSGARRSSIAVTLPPSTASMLLTLDFASAGARPRHVSVEYNGRLLGEANITSTATISAEVKGLPRGEQVLLEVVTKGPTLDCPASRSTSVDPRQMGVMLKFVELVASVEKSSAGTVSEMNGMLDPLDEIETGCIAPEGYFVSGSAVTPMPMDRVVPVAEALGSGALGLGIGWWAPEDFGSWIGAGVATLDLILPTDKVNLHLWLSVVAFGGEDVEVAVSHEGRELIRQRAGVKNPIVADVSELKRGEALTLTLSLPKAKVLGCTADRGTGEDTRALYLMLQAVQLKSENASPFSWSVAHGGGRLGEAVITNSLEAIETNISRFNVFEIDFSWTADGELICLHDWQDSFTSRFGAATNIPLEFEHFRQLLAASPESPRNCDLDGLAGWMRANSDIRIVTDVKERSVEAHVVISERHPDLLDQFVPQAYQPEEIDLYRDLGFASVIWTLYRYGNDSKAVVREAIARTPSAITMPVSMADAGLLQSVSDATKIPVYVHTVNEPETTACFLAAGAAGIYSDDLGDADVAAMRDASNACD